MSSIKSFLSKNHKHIISISTLTSLIISGFGVYFGLNANNIAYKTYTTTIRPIVTLDSVNFSDNTFILRNVTQGTALHVGGFFNLLKENNSFVRFRKNADQVFAGNTSYKLNSSELFGISPNSSFSGLVSPFTGTFCLDYESVDETKYFSAGAFSMNGVGYLKFQEGSCNVEGDAYLNKSSTRRNE